MTLEAIKSIREDLARGLVIPYLGPGVLALAGENCSLPASPEDLVGRMTAEGERAAQDRKHLTAAAQFIENFKHRKTGEAAMNEAFAAQAAPSAAAPLAGRAAGAADRRHLVRRHACGRRWQRRGSGWAEVQGLSQSEHFGTWIGWYDAAGARPGRRGSQDARCSTSPGAAIAPAGNYLVSDSDYRRGADRDRHPDADPARSCSSAAQRAASCSSAAASTTSSARLRAPDHEAFGRPALRRAARGAHAHGGPLPRRV